MRRNHEITFAASDAEKAAMERIYGTGKAGKARMRQALLDPFEVKHTVPAARLVAQLEDIRRRLTAIATLLESRGYDPSEELTLTLATMIGLWERLLKDARKILSTK
jgi:hypothetical protein